MKMGGHVLWLPSNKIITTVKRILANIENGNMSVALFEEIMDPLYTQVALEEMNLVLCYRVN